MKNSCETCVHGYDVTILYGSDVICVPKKIRNDRNFCCDGFRKITMAEIDERTSAKHGVAITGVPGRGFEWQ